MINWSKIVFFLNIRPVFSAPVQRNLSEIMLDLYRFTSLKSIQTLGYLFVVDSLGPPLFTVKQQMNKFTANKHMK